MTDDGRPVVVGVDGSPSSIEALRWAARQAKLWGHPLEVVSTWTYPPLYGPVGVPWPTDLDLEKGAHQILEKAVTELGDQEGLSITQTVLHSHPAPALVDKSRQASLVVVGSRGHGEFAGMLLGSVSEFLASHALCPVLIVR